jgi:hypothetical protein
LWDNSKNPSAPFFCVAPNKPPNSPKKDKTTQKDDKEGQSRLIFEKFLRRDFSAIKSH